MHSIVFRSVRWKVSCCCLVASCLFFAVTAGHANSAPHAVHDVPYLGLYINLDNRFYSAGSDADALAFDSIEGDWAFVVYSAVMSSCSSLSGSSLGDSQTFLVYGLGDPALPITTANYQTFADATGSVAVLSVRSVPGDVACSDQLSLIPIQYDHIYSDGFGGAL